MKNIYLVFTLILFYAIKGYSQDIESFLRPYADAIVQETSFEFTDKVTGEKFPSTKNLPINPNLAIESEFLQWRYTSGLLYDGLLELGKLWVKKNTPRLEVRRSPSFLIIRTIMKR